MKPGATLVIGNKNYSSWSLRPWLLLRALNLEFTEVRIPLDTPEFSEQIGAYSRAERVPVLIDGDITIWDSLAIAETVAELWPGSKLWPADSVTRAHARSVSAEMTTGIAAKTCATVIVVKNDIETSSTLEFAVSFPPKQHS